MRDTQNRKKPQRNQSLERGLAVLEAFGPPRAEIGIRELGRLLGLNKSIVHRLARTLTERGFLEQNPETLRYAVGPRAFEVGQRYSLASGPAEAALPVLQRLADHSQLNAYLGVLRGPTVVYLLTLQSSGPIVIRAKPGSPAHVHSTALGKVLLAAHRDPAALLGTKPLPRLTPSTVTDPARVLAEVKTVRAQGHAISDEENLPGVWAVGAPVVDRTGKVVAAISGACPRYQVTKARVPEIVGAVRAAALQISKSLGAPAALSRQPVATPARTRPCS
ncbi:MAG: IclR family transcriptional regulator [Candidatus Rokubacteria bacterium]|nr:IclR family transcriptional regulator [Candidatus Rokubacteria bacterium]